MESEVVETGPWEYAPLDPGICRPSLKDSQAVDIMNRYDTLRCTCMVWWKISDYDQSIMPYRY